MQTIFKEYQNKILSFRFIYLDCVLNSCPLNYIEGHAQYVDTGPSKYY